MEILNKLDKVILALEQCHRDVKYRDCDCCGYAEAGSECERVLMEDALELMKGYRRMMPCEVDSTVYYYDDYAGVVVPGVVSKITIGDAEGNGFVHVDFEETDLKKAIVDLKLWGINLFSTREEAEEADHGN